MAQVVQLLVPMVAGRPVTETEDANADADTTGTAAGVAVAVIVGDPGDVSHSDRTHLRGVCAVGG